MRLWEGLGHLLTRSLHNASTTPELVLIVNGLTSLAAFVPLALYFECINALSLPLLSVGLLAGLVTSSSAFIKIQVLHYIDSAIFLPLFKVLGPAIVIIFGLFFFGESFTVTEWTGLLVSLSVPLLIVSRDEHTRQNNLTLGLVLVAVCAVNFSYCCWIAKICNRYTSSTTMDCFHDCCRNTNQCIYAKCL